MLVLNYQFLPASYSSYFAGELIMSVVNNLVNRFFKNMSGLCSLIKVKLYFGALIYFRIKPKRS